MEHTLTKPKSIDHDADTEARRLDGTECKTQTQHTYRGTSLEASTAQSAESEVDVDFVRGQETIESAVICGQRTEQAR